MHISATRANQRLEKNCHISTYTKIENKSCKVIADSGSCINAVASKFITILGMKLMNPNPYKVTWIDATFINVHERCQIVIQFITYTDNVWCDTSYECWSYHFGMTMVVRLICDHM